MTQLGLHPFSHIRSASMLPDVANTLSMFSVPSDVITEPESPAVVLPKPIPPSKEAIVKSQQLDAAIAINRANTPSNVTAKRNTPRYSMRELNAMTHEQVVERLKDVSGADNRPGWVKTLDIIDLPRNFVQTVVAKTFLPEAHRMAIERGEYDQAGMAKVYGSDLLRAIGVENHVVNAIGGFFVDVMTDPLSFIGGPIGGLKTAGTRGAVELSTQGRRTIMSAIESVSKGRAVADADVRKMFDTALAHAVTVDPAKGGLALTATNAEKAQYLRDAALGKSGKLAGIGEKVGIGRFSQGGFLVEDVYRTNQTVQSVTEQARIQASKKVVSKFTNNGRLLNFAKETGGAEILHVPFIARSTVTVPSFNIPGFSHRFGQQAELQKAASAVVSGKPHTGQTIMRHIAYSNELTSAFNETMRVADELKLAHEVGDPESIEKYTELYEETKAAYHKVRKQGDELRKINPVDLRKEMNTIDDLGDLMTTMDIVDDAEIVAMRARSEVKWADKYKNQFTHADIQSAKDAQEDLKRQAAQLELDDYNNFADALVDENIRSDAFDKIIKRKYEHSADHWRELITASSDDLAELELVADHYHESMQTANAIAELRRNSIRHVMSRDDRMLNTMAASMLRLTDIDLGHMPFVSVDKMIQSLGQTTRSSRIANFSNTVATNLGGIRGNIPDMMRTLRGRITGSDRRATQELDQYVRSVRQAIKASPTVRAEDQDMIMELAGMLAEQRVIHLASNDFPIITNQMKVGTSKARELLKQAKESGILRDQELLGTIESLANDAAAQFMEYANKEVAAGHFDNPLAVYSPLLLTNEASRRASIRRGVGNEKAHAITGSHAGPDALDVSKQRITNMVEFTDLKGKTHAFTVAEGNAYASIDDAMIAAIPDAKRQKHAAKIRDSVAKFQELHGTRLSGDGLTSLMQNNARPMLGSELNQYAESGVLDAITGGALMNGEKRTNMFQTSLAAMVYQRAKAHEIAMAKESLRDIIEPFVIMNLQADIAQRTVADAEAILSNGVKAKHTGDGRILVGNRHYVRMGNIANKFPSDTLFNPSMMLRGDMDNAYIPDTLAAELSRLADAMRPAQMHAVMHAAESVTSSFRLLTLLHPAWAVTNTVGNTFLASMMGMLSTPQRAKDFMRYMKLSTQMHIRRNLEDVSGSGRAGQAFAKIGMGSDETVPIAGAHTKVGDILEEAIDGGVVNGGQTANIQEQGLDHLRRNLDSRGVPGKTTKFAAKVKQMRGNAQGSRVTTTRAKKFADSASGYYAATNTGKIRKLISAWFQVNGSIDDIFRTAVYMMLRNDGFDAVSAASETRRGMLNFGDMTSFERNTLRPIIPFYSWMRASLPAFALAAIRDPKQISLLPKINQGLEQAFAGDERLPRHMRPRWIQETMGIQLGADPETRGALLLGTLMPQEGFVQAATGAIGLAASITPGGQRFGYDGNDFLDGVRWLMGQTSPVVRTPFELATGREVFSQRAIGIREGQGEITLEDYMLNMLRPVKEFGLGIQKGKVQEAFERSPAEGVSRLLIGGRLQSGLQEDRRTTDLYFDLKDKENEIRKAIRLSEKRGDDGRVAKLKFNLLAEYKRFLERGGSLDAIPKWAREDLAAFAQ